MATVEAFEISGLKLWFWSHDPHAEPHFHAKKTGKWEVRVRFMLSRENMIEVIWTQPPGSAPRSQDTKQICRLAELHRVALLKEWEKKVCHDA